jgi:hypothetical protein
MKATEEHMMGYWDRILGQRERFASSLGTAAATATGTAAGQG